ncbi:hypothetical protein [uncultured Tateyamaria sp.]|uniref:hypothetical protein n=1 Tax=uncultured Tateyamaria sp. TaxID=455651 RepID=UPI002614575E|nr:hypothetical protein [uncultured Tateyamaria sp.]
MQHMKEIVTAVGTLAIAVGIGFVMQSSDTAKDLYGAQSRPVSVLEVLPKAKGLGDSVSADVLMQVQEIELTSATDSVAVSVPNGEAVVERVSAPSTADVVTEPDTMPLGQSCDITATAEPIAGAMVNLSLAAPCAINERLTVHHNGMMFTETTDQAGNLTVTVPALAEQAVFIMAFSNGDGAVAQTTVADIAEYDRVALQWRGQIGFELHAREFGADYGQPGHVWSGAEQNVVGLTTGDNGFIMQMGDTLAPEPLMAEIYSFASGMTPRDGTIDLSVEAEVTQNNCGVEIEAQSLEMMQGGQMKTKVLTLAVPDCDAVGSFLVLNNLVSDLKVASN